MKVLLSWLREYADVSWPARELADRLTMAGLEVESMTSLGNRADGVVVGTVRAVEPHPDADRLSVCAEDVVLDLYITTNRPDCMSVVGVAREVAALARSPLRLPAITVHESGPPISELAAVTLEDSVGCPRFVGRVITDVHIGLSPAWLVHRLEASGVRSINNVVDVTNYVMLEIGQPLHAYDRDRLAGHEIIVRRACDGEHFTTLDGVERILTSEVLMIADRDRGIGIAGVMGGLDTEITYETTTVFLEGACFDPVRMRRGEKHLGLSTEASRRFERGVDPELQVMAVDRATQLIAELTGGTVATGMIDQRGAPHSPQTLRLRVNRVNRILGTAITSEEIAALLRALQFSVRGEGVLTVDVPSFRRDVAREIDLIEEVARLYGYERIVPQMSSPSVRRLDTDQKEAQEDVRQRQKERVCRLFRETLVGLGLTEVITHSFVNPNDLKAVDPQAAPLLVVNPISPELSAMRTLLAVPMLGVVRWNLNRKARDLRIFEIGRTFRPTSTSRLPDEPIQLCIAMTGQRETPHWSRAAEPIDFFDVKGVMDALLVRFALDKAGAIPYDGTWTLFDPEQSASLLVGDEPIGAYGAVTQSILNRFEIAEPVFLLEIDCEYFIRSGPPERRYRPLPKYPAVERDLAIIVPDPVDHQSVVDAIRTVCGPLLEWIELFDVYRGPQIPAGKKNLAYALRYRSPERTLTDEEVSHLQARAVEHLARMYGATLRV